jgi:hypothetical protein
MGHKRQVTRERPQMSEKMLKTKSKGRTKDKSLLLFFGVELSEHKG